MLLVLLHTVVSHCCPFPMLYPLPHGSLSAFSLRSLLALFSSNATRRVIFIQGRNTYDMFVAFLRGLISKGHDVQLITATTELIIDYRLVLARLTNEDERAVWGLKSLMIKYPDNTIASFLVPVGSELATTMRKSPHSGNDDCYVAITISL